ncbi:hypothetical protein [Enterococcus mundtii]|uniref:Type VII secretion protein EssA n=1 Tax=Enterococcus mundtii TaxID=53346 RepID=A0A2S7RRF3_ENTMU|nr:hypothetical protein [Enterococcus mundtii]MDA9461194.1 hypothetical protein [Enterococcus mundtii 3F]PQF22190.1 hypothetical protein CUS89_11695 [Enterococcus mundtii]
MVQKKIEGLLFLLVLLLCLSIPHLTVFAGTLTINNHVIYQEREGIEDHETTFVVHDLFLEDKTKLDQERVQQERQQISMAQNLVFVSKATTQPQVFEQTIIPQLFKEEQMAVGHQLSDNPNHTSIQGRIVLWILLLLGSILLTVGGTYFGKKFSQQKYKND